jgi:probable F420-dependent oxidoreductase
VRDACGRGACARGRAFRVDVALCCNSAAAIAAEVRMSNGESRVECGLFFPQVATDFGGLVERARACEDGGWHSLWLADHMWARGLPDVDHLEIWTALAAVAARTTRLRLGSLVLCNSYRNPALVAKMAASLDQISEGRLELGIGAGWMDEEYRGYGYNFPPVRVRIEQLEEGLEVIRRLFTEPRATFQGKYYSLDDAPNNPKPRQKPHPPITIGGYSPVVVQRAVRLGDGFNGGNVPLDRVAPIVMELHRAAREIGRDPATLHVVSRGSYQVTDQPQGKNRRPLWGTLDEIREDIARYAAAGLTELFLEPNFQPGGAVLERTLAHMEALAP